MHILVQTGIIRRCKVGACGRTVLPTLMRLIRRACYVWLLLLGVVPALSASPTAPVAPAKTNPADERPATDDERQLIEQELRPMLLAARVAGDFILIRSSTERAAADVRGNKRIIFFGQQLLDELQDPKNRWIARLVLAHEVGHHIFLHPMVQVDPAERARIELVADRFAGMVIARMGGTLAQLKAGFMTFDEIRKGGYPPRDERFAAGNSGWLAVTSEHEELAGKMNTESKRTVPVVWRKSGINWTEYRQGQSYRNLEEIMRDDEFITLKRSDGTETLLIPLATGEVLANATTVSGQAYATVGTITWPQGSRAMTAAAATRGLASRIDAVPVQCSNDPGAVFACASENEKLAIATVSNGAWQKGQLVVYPAQWRIRENVDSGVTSILPESASLLARHQFRITVGASSATIPYAELKLHRTRSDEAASMMYAPPVPVTPILVDQGNDSLAARIGVVAPSQVPAGIVAAPPRKQIGNFVMLRYILYKNGKPCLDELKDALTTQQRCGAAIELHGNVAITATPTLWSATVSYPLQDEDTANPTDFSMAIDLTCGARRTLSVEAFSAACQVVWEAMARSREWSRNWFKLAAAHANQPTAAKDGGAAAGTAVAQAELMAVAVVTAAPAETKK